MTEGTKKITMPKLYKICEYGKAGQKRLEAPKDATGYYRREVSADGMTITYRKVA